MKMIANSVVPSSPLPYLHIGYISAMPVNFAGPTFALMLVWIAIAAYAWKKSRVFGGIFLLLAVASFHVAVSQYNQGKEKLAFYRTRSSARAILTQVIELASAGKDVPSDLQTLSHNSYNSLLDGWNHSYRLSKRTEHGLVIYVLTSGGPDGQFGTVDDIVTEQEIDLPLRNAQHSHTTSRVHPVNKH